MSSEEREIRGLLRPFARFQSLEEHEDLVTSLLREVELKQAVEQILLAKHVGCQNLEDLERLVFDSDNSAKIDRVVKELRSCLEKGKFEEENISKRKLLGKMRSEKIRDKKTQNKINQDFDEGAKNFHLVYNETKLCERVGLKFEEYMLVKELIIREFIQNDRVNRKRTRMMVNLEARVFDAVFDLLVKNDVVIEDLTIKANYFGS